MTSEPFNFFGLLLVSVTGLPESLNAFTRRSALGSSPNGDREQEGQPFAAAAADDGGQDDHGSLMGMVRDDHDGCIAEVDAGASRCPSC